MLNIALTAGSLHAAPVAARIGSSKSRLPWTITEVAAYLKQESLKSFHRVVSGCLQSQTLCCIATVRMQEVLVEVDCWLVRCTSWKARLT